MNKIIPNIGNSVNNRESMRRKMAQQPINRITTPLNVSFKGAESLLPEAEQKILNVFSQNYGSIGQNIIQKVDKLTNSQNLKDKTTQVLKKSSRFTIEQGALSIKEKSIWQSLAENVVFPIKSLPPYIGSWLLKKGESVPALKSTCENLYKKPIFRTPRKLNELNSKTDIIKGIFEKTQSIALDAAKKYDIKPEVIMDELSNVKDNPQASEAAKKASEYVKENLYKVSNKFFDKHTGNFNTAYERPLNRIVSGMIPVMFLANDAYNLSVLCGDKKEVSKKEAKQREKQEISRVLTTAYIQLLTFGAFTKQVNTIPWFTPLTSAATVLFSEIFSRVTHGKPILFLTKEKAQAYNKKQNKKHDGKTETKNVNTMQAVPANNSQEPFKHLQMNPKKDSNIFKSFKADSQNLNSVQPSFIGGKTDDKNSGLANNPVSSASNTSQSEKKEKPQKALINFSTFKKGVAFLISAGFALSFLKNSSYTKNSKIIKSIGDTGNFFKKNVYDKLAFKDFSISENEFKQVTDSLKEAGCKEIAEGHEFIKNKYGTIINNNIIMQKSSLSSEGTKNVLNSVLEFAKTTDMNLKESELTKIKEAVKTACSLKNTEIAENKFSDVAEKSLEIIKNKNVNLSEETVKSLSKNIIENIEKEAKKSTIQVETKLKPFVDIVIQPFKFVMSAAKLPFKITSSAIKLAVSPIENKAKQAVLGEAELKNYEKLIHNAVVQIFGESKSNTGKISQTVFVNAIEQLNKKTLPYRNAEAALKEAIASGKSDAEIEKARQTLNTAKQKLMRYVNTAVENSFNGVTQSSNKNTDLAMMSKLASSTVTSAFLVADNYNMVMIKSNGEDKESAKETANERIIQRLSGLFYQALFINWFNATFRTTYNSSLKGMTAVVIPNTLTTEVLTRKSIGMPVGKKSFEELQANEEKNENRKGFIGKYFKFMRLLTGKKPLKDRMPKDKTVEVQKNTANTGSTNLLERYTK